MPIDPIETLWINAQRLNTPGGTSVTKAEADEIIRQIRAGGVTDPESRVVDTIITRFTQASARADADAGLAAADLGMSGAAEVTRSRLGAQNGTLEITDVLRTNRDMGATDADARATAQHAERTQVLLGQANYIRREIEIARRIPTIIDNLSYGAFDWKVFDSEARAALKEVKEAGELGYANVVIRHLAIKDSGKFLRRLVNQLPSDGKRTLRGIVNGLDEQTRSVMQRSVGNDLWNQLQRA